MDSQTKSAQEAPRNALFNLANLQISDGSKYSRIEATQASGKSPRPGLAVIGDDVGADGCKHKDPTNEQKFGGSEKLEERLAPIKNRAFKHKTDNRKFYTGKRLENREKGKTERGGKGTGRGCLKERRVHTYADFVFWHTLLCSAPVLFFR